MDGRERAPRWVRVLGISAVALVLLFLALQLVTGGSHGPGRHLGPTGPSSGTVSTS